MTPRRLKLATAAILVIGVLAAGSQLAPTGSSPERGSAAAAAAAVAR